MITARGVGKRYGDRTALDGFSLHVPPGTVCGLLGPNGAGKSTAIRVLTTLSTPDEGCVEVAGLDVRREPDAVRERIGLTGQHLTVDEFLSGRESLLLWARLFGLTGREVTARVDGLLDRFGLADAAHRPVRTWSGGMKRRLDIASSLVHVPQVLFLDEPTTGLDPRSRTDVWAMLRTLVADGMTMLITTQYLDEADQLADSISVLDSGRVVAEGTPSALKRAIGGDRLELTLVSTDDVPAAATLLAAVADAEPEVDRALRRVTAPVHDPLEALGEVAVALRQAGLGVADVALRKPTLDEVFLQVTQRSGARP